MPTYEYECNNCGFDFEAFHSMSEEITVCPKCDTKNVRKLIGTGIGVIVKGTETPVEYQKIEERERVAEERRQKRERIKENAPWWRSRDDGQIRKDILKNPQKYVEEGKV